MFAQVCINPQVSPCFSKTNLCCALRSNHSQVLNEEQKKVTKTKSWNFLKHVLRFSRTKCQVVPKHLKSPTHQLPRCLKLNPQGRWQCLPQNNAALRAKWEELVTITQCLSPFEKLQWGNPKVKLKEDKLGRLRFDTLLNTCWWKTNSF